jgi:hypothetical protein
MNVRPLDKTKSDAAVCARRGDFFAGASNRAVLSCRVEHARHD